MLPTLVDDSDNPTFIFVTADADLSNLGDFITSSHGAGAERTEILLFDPTEKFENKELHTDYVDYCRARFAENKLELTTVTPPLGDQKTEEGRNI